MSCFVRMQSKNLLKMIVDNKKKLLNYRHAVRPAIQNNNNFYCMINKQNFQKKKVLQYSVSGDDTFRELILLHTASEEKQK